MITKDEKSLSFDEFKEEVYKRIGTLEVLDQHFINKQGFEKMDGCLGFFLRPFFTFTIKYGSKKTSEAYKVEELSVKADEILARKEIKDLLCANLDATVSLPIEAAYKLTPVLYELAQKDDQNIPINSVLFAIICRRIVTQGVQNYCA